MHHPVAGMIVRGGGFLGRITRVTAHGFYVFDEARMRYALVRGDAVITDDGDRIVPVRFDEVTFIDRAAAHDLGVAPLRDPAGILRI